MIGEGDTETTVAAVRDCFERYNAALERGDVEALNGFFWDSPSTIRFGPTETLFGYEAIAAFRSRTWKGTAGGRIIETVVVTAFGPDMATTNALIRSADGAVSRQSQTWVNLPEGWRIVAAHVSASPP
jgi:ketosteroid isomerase-like protein